jgi:hypothetical protein
MYCARGGTAEGVICAHGPIALRESHWSCCGSTNISAHSPDCRSSGATATPTAAAAAAAAATAAAATTAAAAAAAATTPDAASGSGLRIVPGSRVSLALGFESQGDATGGPLRNMLDVGTVRSVSSGNCNVEFNGRTWHYRLAAVRNADVTGSGMIPAVQHLQPGDFVGQLGGMVLRCDDTEALLDLWVLVYSTSTTTTTTTSSASSGATAAAMACATLRASYAVGGHLMVVGPREALFVFDEATDLCINVLPTDMLVFTCFAPSKPDSRSSSSGGGVGSATAPLVVLHNPRICTAQAAVAPEFFLPPLSSSLPMLAASGLDLGPSGHTPAAALTTATPLPLRPLFLAPPTSSLLLPSVSSLAVAAPTCAPVLQVRLFHAVGNAGVRSATTNTTTTMEATTTAMNGCCCYPSQSLRLARGAVEVCAAWAAQVKLTDEQRNVSSLALKEHFYGKTGRPVIGDRVVAMRNEPTYVSLLRVCVSMWWWGWSWGWGGRLVCKVAPK